MPASPQDNDKIIRMLVDAYNAEIETVMNYLANSVNLDGLRAEHVKDSLAQDVTEELGHARRLAERIKVLGGSVPGSQALKWSQGMLQPPQRSTDVQAVVRGVIEAEEDAIARYESIIKACDGIDPVTQDVATQILGDEQNHRREFIGFLKEFESESR